MTYLSVLWTCPRINAIDHKLEMPKYRYGVAKTIKGDVRTFVCRDLAPEPNPERYPENHKWLVLNEVIEECSSKEAHTKAQEMLENIESIYFKDHNEITKQDCPGAFAVKKGDVAHHSDQQGSHQAVILGEFDDMVQAVFFTSSPGFGIRKATTEELGCIGFGYSRETFLAPVVRPKNEFVAEGIQFPQYRVDELLKEFF